MISHFKELLWHYRRAILLTGALIGIGALIASLAILKISPSYNSRATLLVEPAQKANFAHRTYDRHNLASVPDHIDRLASRGIATKTLRAILEEDAGLMRREARTLLEDIVTSFAHGADYFWHFLNYGLFRHPSDADAKLTELRNAVRVRQENGTRLIHIDVTTASPMLSALVANKLSVIYIEELRLEMKESRAAYRKAVSKRISTKGLQLEDVLKSQHSVLNPLVPEGIDLERLNTRRRLIEADLEKLQDIIREMEIASGVSALPIRIVEKATVSTYPIRPTVLLNTLYGIMAGLGLATVSALLRDLLSRKIHSFHSLRNIVQGAVLPSIYPSARTRAEKWVRFDDSGFIQNLEPYARALSRALAGSGAIDSRGIYVTGLLSEKEIIAARDVIGAAIRISGDDVPSVVAVPPLTTRFDWSALPEITNRCAVVCVVPPGELEAQDLLNVRDLIMAIDEEVRPLFVLSHR